MIMRLMSNSILMIMQKINLHILHVWHTCPTKQWRKIWGSGSVRSSHQTVSDYTPCHWFPNTQQFQCLTACRRLEKLVLPSIFLHKSFILDDVKFAELYSNSFEWKNVTFFGGGIQNILWPLLHIFRGQDPRNPHDLCPCYKIQHYHSCAAASLLCLLISKH